MTDAAQEIKKMWLIFAVGKSSILELRALSPQGTTPVLKPFTKHFRAADYVDEEVCKRAFEQEAMRLNVEGYNIYIMLNPISTAFTGHAAGDNDIAYRDLLLIDIDRTVKKVEPANNAEVEAARQVADAIKVFMQERGWSDPIRVMSGNGHHLYYVLKDVPNTTEAATTVQQVLHNLAAKFDNADVKVDTAVYNASRITKVPGTIMRKGMESAGRPYRMAVVYEE
jgi:hypothetical protein